MIHAPPRVALAVLAAIALSACAGASPAGGTPVPPAAGAPTPPGESPPAGAASAAAASPSTPPAPPAPTKEPLPTLTTGDRWYVTVRAAAGKDPIAERHRRAAAEGGRIRESVSWGRSFAALAAPDAAVAQVRYLEVREGGLAALPEGSAAAGCTEIAFPLRPGTTWEVDLGSGRRTRARIEAREKVATPGGTVEGALRVVHEALGGERLRMTTWYDAGLRPVRAEVRDAQGNLVEARAALAGEAPTPEQCRAAVEWAAKHLVR